MNKINFSHFGEIDFDALKSEYSKKCKIQDENFVIDINFFDKTASNETIEKIKTFLGELEDHIRNVYKYLNDDYEFEGETYGYIEHHLESLEAATLKEIIGKDISITEQDDELFSHLKIRRIGLYPEDDGEFAIFDFSLGEDISEYILAIFVDVNGHQVDLGIER